MLSSFSNSYPKICESNNWVLTFRILPQDPGSRDPNFAWTLLVLQMISERWGVGIQKDEDKVYSPQQHRLSRNTTTSFL